MTKRQTEYNSFKPNPIDCHVGNQMRIKRMAQHITQRHMADMIGVSFQQVQKYETGKCRISASKLWLISLFLCVPVDYFFKGIQQDIKNSPPLFPHRQKTDIQNIDPMKTKETFILVNSYYKIPDRSTAIGLLQLMKMLSCSNHRFLYSEKDID